jgi:ribosome-binding factor A
MNEKKGLRVKEILQRAAAEFLNCQSELGSIITITKVEIATGGRQAKIFFTVFPEEKESPALIKAKRLRSDFRDWLKEKTGLIFLPFIDFVIDFGEKNRQNVDRLSAETEKPKRKAVS